MGSSCIVDVSLILLFVGAFPGEAMISVEASFGGSVVRAIYSIETLFCDRVGEMSPKGRDMRCSPSSVAWGSRLGGSCGRARLVPCQSDTRRRLRGSSMCWWEPDRHNRSLVASRSVLWPPNSSPATPVGRPGREAEKRTEDVLARNWQWWGVMPWQSRHWSPIHAA